MITLDIVADATMVGGTHHALNRESNAKILSVEKGLSLRHSVFHAVFRTENRSNRFSVERRLLNLHRIDRFWSQKKLVFVKEAIFLGVSSNRARVCGMNKIEHKNMFVGLMMFQAQQLYCQQFVVCPSR